MMSAAPDSLASSLTRMTRIEMSTWSCVPASVRVQGTGHPPPPTCDDDDEHGLLQSARLHGASHKRPHHLHIQLAAERRQTIVLHLRQRNGQLRVSTVKSSSSTLARLHRRKMPPLSFVYLAARQLCYVSNIVRQAGGGRELRDICDY